MIKLEKGAWSSLSIGLVLAIVSYQFPLLRIICSGLITLVHELGHSMVGWGFGRLAIPSFDLIHGGGVAHIPEQNEYFLYFIYFLLFIAIIKSYKYYIVCASLIILTAIHYWINISPPMFQILCSFMGHGTETIFASIFLYRAISNTAIITPLDRPLYAFLAFYIFIHNILFANKLMFDKAYKIIYLEGKGGITNDFVEVANLISKITFENVACFYLIYIIFLFIITFIFFHIKKELISEPIVKV